MAIRRLVVTPPLVSGVRFRAGGPTTQWSALFGLLYSCVVHPQLDVRIHGPSLRPAITVLLWPKRNRLITSRTLSSPCHALSPQFCNMSRTIKRRNAYNILLGTFGREESFGPCLNLTLNCNVWGLKW